MKTTTIDRIVRDICVMRGYEYMPTLIAVRRVIENLSIHVFPDFENKEYTIPASLIISLDDLGGYPVLIGHPSNNRLVTIPFDSTLGVDNTVLSDVQCTCSQTTSDSDSGNNGYCLFHGFGYTSAYSYGENYGWRSDMKTRGAWKYDAKANLIVFDSGTHVQSGSKIVIRFKPVAQRENFQQVPSMYFMMILHKVTAMMEAISNVSASQNANNQFIAEMHMLDDLLLHIDPEQIADSIRGYNSIKA